MPDNNARRDIGAPPSPGGGWSSETTTLHHAVVVPPIDSGMVQACGVLDRNGNFCAHSATWRGSRAMMTAPQQPTEIADKLAGRHLFAGQLWAHFGHFMAESMSRLWALDTMDPLPDSIIFIPKRPGKTNELKGYQQEFITLLGINIPIQVIEKPTEIEELIIPGQGFGLGEISAGTDAFRSYFANNFAKDITAKGAEMIYLSRSRLGGMEGGAVLEDVLESNLEREGYRIFHPQMHSLADQIAQYKAAKTIVGLDGSAFHLFGFVGKPDQKVAVILRRNSNVFQGLHSQIRAFSGINPTLINVVTADWIPQNKQRPGRYSFGQLDFDALFEQLLAEGFLQGGKDWRAPRFREMKQSMMGLSAAKGVEFFRVKKEVRGERPKTSQIGETILQHPDPTKESDKLSVPPASSPDTGANR